MSLRDDLAAARVPVKSKLVSWIDGLSKDDREALLEAAVDSSLSNQTIMQVLSLSGYKASRETIGQWRASNGYTR